MRREPRGPSRLLADHDLRPRLTILNKNKIGSD